MTDFRQKRAASPYLRAVATSDVSRVRDIAIVAGVVGVATLGVLVAFRHGMSSAPGPLSRPHERKGVACSSCHGTANETPTAVACVGCHGGPAHASTRPGHRAMTAKGQMSCLTCHPAHHDAQGVTFLGDGRQLLWSGTDESSGTQAPAGITKGTTVPLVSLSTCAGCHDEKNAKDPIALCRRNGVSACFDEHQRVGVATPPGTVCAAQHQTSRFLAWEAAETAAEVGPWPRPSPVPSLPLFGIGIPLLAGAATMASLYVARGARTSKKKREAPVPVVPAQRVRLPQIDTSTCLGCYACVDACPFDVLEIQKYVAVVARPADCCGVILCEQVCPNGSLSIAEGEPIATVPQVDEHLESVEVPGVFLAGDLTGLPLIKNAIGQGTRAIDRIAQTKTKAGTDVIIIGAGPAGISAALRARELGLSYVTLEQGAFAQSIRAFPREKLVFDQPLDIPTVGELWLRESTKEELLAEWTRIVRARKLDIREHHRVVDVERAADGTFTVRAVHEEAPVTFTGRAIVVAIGRRGSPRKLDASIDPEAESMVSYALADARSFAKKRVLVVGLGDSAMEAAIALSHQPDTEVTVTYRGNDFSRGKARNVSEMRSLVARGRIRLEFQTEITRVMPGRVTLRTARGDERRLDCDNVLVLIGGVPSRELLTKIGIRDVHAADRLVT